MLVTDLLARNGRQYSHEVALVQVMPSQNLRQQITWQEFDEKANKIANFLISTGLQKDDKVLHMMMNSIDWLVAYFGILRTGAWAAPLNYRFNSQDIKFCADIAEPKAFMLGDEFVERVAAIRPELNTIEDYIFWGLETPPNMVNLGRELDRYSTREPEVELKPDDACGLYFTSGTTGTPKPIVLMHKGLEYSAISSAFHRRDTHSDIFLIVGPLYHASSIMHWLGSLMVGARGVLLIDSQVTPQCIFDTIHKERITELHIFIPWLLDILSALDSGELKKEDYDLSCLRLIHMGAQPIHISLIEHWKRYFPDVLYNENYGLTETTGPGCICIVEAAGVEKRAGSIGKPGFNWEVGIVNDEDEAVPVGEIGEVVARGDGIMKEYYHNPEETAKVLKNGWLHTGDLGKVDNDGYFYLVGRKKDVIISGGENIYPTDVESVLVTHDKVLDAALIGIPNDRLGEIAVAIIEAKQGVTLTEVEMVKFCEEKFPRYRRPRKIILDKVPRDGVGKIQKPYLRQKYSTIKQAYG